MPYDPARYIPDYSWIARAGQDIGGLVETLGKIPEAVEMDKALQEHRVTNEDMYRDMRSYAKNIPTEVLDRMGTSRQDLGATMPKAFRKEVPVAYAKRLSEWVSPIVRSMVQAGLSADEIKQFGFSMPSQVGIGAAPGVEKAAAEARTREVEQFGQKQIAPGVTPDVSVPIGAEPQPAQPGGPVPARPEITLFGGEEVRPEASTRRELLTQAGAIGISPEQMKKTGAYQGMPPEQKPMTEYQQVQKEYKEEYLQYLRSKRVGAAADKDEQEFRQEHSALFSANQRAGKKANEERKVLESIEEAEKARAQEMEQAKQAVADEFADPDAKRSATADIQRLRREGQKNVKDHAAAVKALGDAEREAEEYQRALDEYERSGGRIGFKQALERAQGKGSTQPIGAAGGARAKKPKTKFRHYPRNSKPPE
ncbi:MAG: hypothetical protein U9Q07_09225 [Planctomycetota bacterium]|nr:hypothetical protein [Planctomycetota bacterium]